MRTEQLQQNARARLETELQAVYTQLPIADPASFSGRDDLLESCRARLAVKGMSFVIYGERGLGKTSFTNVLLVGKKRISRTAEDGMSFERLLGEVLSTIGEGEVLTGRRALDKGTLKGSLKSPIAQYGSELSSEDEESYEPLSRRAVELDIVADALWRHAKEVEAVVIDEFHRLLPSSQRAIVHLMKTLADRGGDVRVVAVGTRRVGEELMEDREYKDYIGRSITPVALPRMSNAELRDIINKRVEHGVAVSEDVASDLVWVASGYPALIHRVMFDASVSWLRRNSTNLLTSTVGAGLSIASPVLAITGPVLVGLVMSFVKLRRAGVTVGPDEMVAALRAHVNEYEREELRGRPIADLETQRILREYALSDDEELDLDIVASRAGLRPSAARRAWRQHASQLVDDDERRLLPGLRPYLRAKLVLEGEASAARSSTSKR